MAQTSGRLRGFVEVARNVTHVKRFHVVPTHMTDTVAAHSFRVAMLSVAICETKPSTNMILAALYHDLNEAYLGDMPRYVKHDFPDLHEELKKVEQIFDEEFGLNVELTEDEKRIVRLADITDAIHFALDEIRLGNIGMRAVFDRALKYALQLKPIGKSPEILLDARSEYLQLVGE